MITSDSQRQTSLDELNLLALRQDTYNQFKAKYKDSTTIDE